MLIPQGDSVFRKIHRIFFLSSWSINNLIPKKAVHLYYTILENRIQKVVEAGRQYMNIKRNIKNNFNNILLAPHVQ